MASRAPSNELFCKFVVLVVWAGACGAVLLTLRQARLQASNEFAEARLRERMLSEQVDTVRAELASLVTPEQIEGMAAELAVRTRPWAADESDSESTRPGTDRMEGARAAETPLIPEAGQ